MAESIASTALNALEFLPEFGISLESDKKDYYATNLEYTGTAIWFGGKNLATFAKDNVTKFTQKSVLELGSGTGIVGIALAKHLFEKEATELGDPYLLTDGFEKVVEMLSNNCRNNEVKIKCELLRWNEGEDIQKLQRTYVDGFDCILGADLYYNRSQGDVVRNIFATVAALLSHDPHAAFYLSVTRRDLDINTVLDIATDAGFSHELAEDYVWDIFDNNTDGMTEFWRDAIYIFRRSTAPLLSTSSSP